MNAREPLVTGAGWVAVAAYVWVLLGVALGSRRARRDDSLADFYLAGRSFGPILKPSGRGWLWTHRRGRQDRRPSAGVWPDAYSVPDAE